MQNTEMQGAEIIKKQISKAAGELCQRLNKEQRELSEQDLKVLKVMGLLAQDVGYELCVFGLKTREGLKYAYAIQRTDSELAASLREIKLGTRQEAGSTGESTRSTTSELTEEEGFRDTISHYKSLSESLRHHDSDSACEHAPPHPHGECCEKEEDGETRHSSFEDACSGRTHRK